MATEEHHSISSLWPLFPHTRQQSQFSQCWHSLNSSKVCCKNTQELKLQTTHWFHNQITASTFTFKDNIKTLC